MTFRLSSRGQQITTCQLSRAHCFNKYAFIEAQLQLFIYSTIYGCSCPRGNNCNKGGVILQLKMFTIKVLSKNFTVTKSLLTPTAETQTVVQPLLLRTGRHSMTEKLGWPRSALASGFSLTILPTLAPSYNTPGNATLPRRGPCCFHLTLLPDVRFFPKSTNLWSCSAWVNSFQGGWVS